MSNLHIMIDLETWGLVPGCVIRSVGMVAFNPHGDEFETGRDFTFEMYANVEDPRPSYALPAQPIPFNQAPPPQIPAPSAGYRPGFTIVPGPNGYDFYRQATTQDWWALPENAETQKKLLINREPVEMVIGRILQVFELLKPVRVWARGPQGDIVWLEYYFRAYSYNVPWHYGDVRDVRGFIETTEIEQKQVAEGLEGVGRTFESHHALDDARFQAYLVQAGHWRLNHLHKGYNEFIRRQEALTETTIPAGKE